MSSAASVDTRDSLRVTSPAGPPVRVRQRAREALVVMAVSAGLSCALAVLLLVATSLAAGMGR